MVVSSARRRELHLKHIREGRCVSCYERATANSTYCVRHRDMSRARSSRNNAGIRKRYKDEHRCPRCGAPLDDTECVTCVNCRSGKYQFLMARRRGSE